MTIQEYIKAWLFKHSSEEVSGGRFITKAEYAKMIKELEGEVVSDAK